MNRDQSEQYNDRTCLAILMIIGGPFVRCNVDIGVRRNNITLTGPMMYENAIK